MEFNGDVESSRAMVGVGSQTPSQCPRTPHTKSCSIQVTVHGSGGEQVCGRCMIFPSCSLLVFWRSSLFTAVVMLWRMMRQKTLLVMDSCMMPLQLLQSDRFHFFGSLMIVPLFQASGITSLSQTSCRMC